MSKNQIRMLRWLASYDVSPLHCGRLNKHTLSSLLVKTQKHGVLVEWDGKHFIPTKEANEILSEYSNTKPVYNENSTKLTDNIIRLLHLNKIHKLKLIEINSKIA